MLEAQLRADLRLHLRQSSQVDLVAAAQRQVGQELELLEDLEAVGHQQRAVAATEQTQLNNSARALRKAREDQALTSDPGSEGLDTSSPTASHLEDIMAHLSGFNPGARPNSLQTGPKRQATSHNVYRNNTQEAAQTENERFHNRKGPDVNVFILIF